MQQFALDQSHIRSRLPARTDSQGPLSEAAYMRVHVRSGYTDAGSQEHCFKESSAGAAGQTEQDVLATFPSVEDFQLVSFNLPLSTFTFIHFKLILISQ